MSKTDVTLLVIGLTTDGYYLVDRVFGEEPVVTDERQVWRFQLPALIRSSAADIIVACNAHPSHRRYSPSCTEFFLPRFIMGGMSIETALARIETSSSIRRDIARIRKGGFAYEMSTSPADFWWFYDAMYVPYVRSTFGRSGVPAPRAKFKALIPNSTLLFATKDGQRVAGELLVSEGDTVRGAGLGVLGGDREYTRLGAVAAMYYFHTLELAKNSAVRYLNMGGSRPFLSDGVLHFKRRWGVTITGARSTGFLFFRLKDGPGVRAFLRNNPFIFQDAGGGLVGAIFHDGVPTERTHQGLAELIKSTALPGLSALNVYLPDAAELPPECSDLRLDIPLRTQPLMHVFAGAAS